MISNNLSIRFMSNYTYLLLSVFIFSGCTSSNNKSYIENNSIKHVILIGSDGFGAYAFNNKANIPNIREMMLKGSYSLKARAVFPTSSAVNWASMIMGSGPELHGFTEWGSKQPELPPRVNGTDSIYPSIISLINEQLPNEKKGVVYTWSGIGYLFEKSLVDLNYNGKSDNDTLDKALEFIVSEKPAFTFIHFDEPDITGHDRGHDTEAYYKAIQTIDSHVGTIGSSSILLTSSSTFFGMVAENIKTCFDFEHNRSIFFTSFMKPMSNIRSASSTTKISI
jgi:predicted AlkP superfamily pyrophosphatase or phosphodiesterase